MPAPVGTASLSTIGCIRDLQAWGTWDPKSPAAPRPGASADRRRAPSPRAAFAALRALPHGHTISVGTRDVRPRLDQIFAAPDEPCSPHASTSSPAEPSPGPGAAPRAATPLPAPPPAAAAASPLPAAPPPAACATIGCLRDLLCLDDRDALEQRRQAEVGGHAAPPAPELDELRALLQRELGAGAGGAGALASQPRGSTISIGSRDLIRPGLDQIFTPPGELACDEEASGGAGSPEPGAAVSPPALLRAIPLPAAAGTSGTPPGGRRTPPLPPAACTARERHEAQWAVPGGPAGAASPPRAATSPVPDGCCTPPSTAQEHKLTGDQLRELHRVAAERVAAPGFAEAMATRPCLHNNWDNVRLVKGRMGLRCRSCGEHWKPMAQAIAKCPAFFDGYCPDGVDCALPHIHRYKNKEKEALRAHRAWPVQPAPCAPTAAAGVLHDGYAEGELLMGLGLAPAAPASAAGRHG